MVGLHPEVARPGPLQHRVAVAARRRSRPTIRPRSRSPAGTAGPSAVHRPGAARIGRGLRAMVARDARQVSWAEAETTGFTTTSSQPASSSIGLERSTPPPRRTGSGTVGNSGRLQLLQVGLPGIPAKHFRGIPDRDAFLLQPVDPGVEGIRSEGDSPRWSGRRRHRNPAMRRPLHPRPPALRRRRSPAGRLAAAGRRRQGGDRRDRWRARASRPRSATAFDHSSVMSPGKGSFGRGVRIAATGETGRGPLVRVSRPGEQDVEIASRRRDQMDPDEVARLPACRQRTVRDLDFPEATVLERDELAVAVNGLDVKSQRGPNVTATPSRRDRTRLPVSALCAVAGAAPQTAATSARPALKATIRIGKSSIGGL